MIPTNLAYAENKTFKTVDLQRVIGGVYHEESSNLKAGDTYTYKFKVADKGKSKMLISFQAEDAGAYSVNILDSKNKKIVFNNKCKKTWIKKFSIPNSGIYKIEVKALKDSAFAVDLSYVSEVSYVTKKYGKERTFIHYNMGVIYDKEGLCIEPIVSGGRWIEMIDHTVNYSLDDAYKLFIGEMKDASYTQFKTVSKAKKYKIPKKSPSCIYYLKDNSLYEYEIETTQSKYHTAMCDEIYNYYLRQYSFDETIWLTIEYVNSSEKTLKKIIFNIDDNGENKKINIPVAVFSNKFGETYINISKKLGDVDSIYINSIKFVYMDDSSKVYDIDDSFWVRRISYE